MRERERESLSLPISRRIKKRERERERSREEETKAGSSAISKIYFLKRGRTEAKDCLRRSCVCLQLSHVRGGVPLYRPKERCKKKKRDKAKKDAVVLCRGSQISKSQMGKKR